MTFVVNAIKQDNEDSKKSEHIQFLLEVDSPLFARKFLEKSWLVLLSLDDFLSSVDKFWPLYAVVLFENQRVRLVGKKEISLKDFCLLFLRMWFSVEDINTFSDPQPLDQVKKIIDFCKKDLEDQKNVQNQQIQKEKDAERKIYYEDDWLEKAKKVIARSLEKVNILLTQKWAFISAKDLRTIKDKVEELKKLRMWTNYEKIRDMLQDLFSLVDRIEEDYYASLQDSSQVLFDGTQVTSVDLERQVSILEKVQQQQMFWWSVSVKRKDYVAFWETLLYLFFLKKDFLHVFDNILLYVYRIFDFLQIGLLFVFVFFSLALVYFSFSSTTEPVSIYYALVSFGFLWCLAYFFSLLRIKSPLLVIVFFALMMVLYFVGVPLLKNTFALS